jgi:hypothetical protein
VLDLWKVAWDHLIWQAMIPKMKAIEGKLNRKPLGKSYGEISGKHTGIQEQETEEAWRSCQSR